MSMSAADGSHELVVAPEFAEVAERLDVPLHAGDRVCFEVVEGDRDTTPTPTARLAGWLAGQCQHRRSHTMSERVEDDVRNGMGRRIE